MRTIIAIAVIFAASSTAAGEITVSNKCSAVTVSNKTSKAKTGCDCSSTGKCECWETQCSCSACGRGKAASIASGIVIDPDHYCDKCGSYSNIVNREANGMHSHVCTNPTCKDASGRQTEWWHKDPPPEIQYTIPSFSNCPNGNCPSPSYGRRRSFR